jgi:cytoskeleton-associated protein 5
LDVQDRLRQYNKEIIRLARKLLTSGRMVEYLMQGFSSKNNRTRVDCVELLGEMLEEEGLAQCTRNKQKPFAAIAQVNLPSHIASLSTTPEN